MQLTHWRITILFEVDEEDGSEAACSASPEYLAAEVRFDLAQIEPDEVDAYVIHELSHCLIWPLANTAQSLCGTDAAHLENVREREEGLATTIERLVLHLTKDE